MLPNAWDVASALAVVAAGFPVVATSSAAVAAVLGYDDHEGAPGEEMLGLAGRIARAVPVPVTVDAEAGYRWDADELVTRCLAAGIAGINLEDSDHRAGHLRDVGEQERLLAGVRAAAERRGVPLVVNARVDSFVAGRGRDVAPHLDDSIARARAYLAAGADCVYPIFLVEPDARRRFVDEVEGPVNLVTWPGGPAVDELARDGVARISYGPTLHHLALRSLNDELGRIAAACESVAHQPDHDPGGGADHDR